MKKFLTVLLVIAVMFTFSFSTAFAAVPNFDKNLGAQYFEIAMKDAKTAGSISLTQAGKTYVIKYATLDAYKAEILEAVLDYEKNGSASAYIDSAAELKDLINAKTSGVFNNDVAMVLVAAQYAADKDAALAILGGLDTSSFSTKEMPASMVAADEHGCKTYVEHVQAEIADAIAAINEYTFTSDSTLVNYAAAKETIDSYFDKYDATDATTQLAKEKGYEIAGTPTTYVGLGVYEINGFAAYKTTYVDALDATSAAQIAAVKAEIAKQYAIYMALSTTDTAEEKAFAANTKKITEFLADEEVELGTISTFFDYATYGDAAADAVANAAAFEAQAARLAAQTDANGALVRDAEDVADYVTEGITYEYCDAFALSTTGLRNIGTCLGLIEDLYLGLDAEKLAFEKAIRATFVSELISGFEKNATYYPLELAKVKALTEEYLAKVNAVTEIDKVDDYDVTYFGADIASYTALTLSSKVGAVKTAVKVNELSASLKAVAEDYALLMNGQITKADNRYYGVGVAGLEGDFAKLHAEINKLVGNSEARTAKEIAALSSQAVALISTLPTVAEVEAAAEAVEDAVDAIPATVTVAHKEVIDAAIAANKAYKALTTVDHAEKSDINTAVVKYAYAYNNALVAQVKAVDKTDKAALKALKTEINTFKKTYGTTLVGDIVATELGKVQTALDNIKATEGKAVKAAIVAIPVNANITAAAAAKVEAARALYDAYVAEYTSTYDFDYNNAVTTDLDGFVADDFAYATIVNAETILGLNDNSEEIAKMEAIAAIEGLKIKASSTKAKGSITVKWTVSEEVEGVKYQVYKSTKAHKGYKKSITTTKTTFKNTKNLKAGTRYYYKVRAIGVVDGVTYYSDWSNKANRVAK